MDNKQDVLVRIEEKYASMSKSHKAIAGFIKEHYDQAVFMTAAKLGEELSISESTVVRFASGLGYEGYPEFQKALADWVKNKLSNVQKMDVKYANHSQSEILTSVLEADIEKLQDTIGNLDADAFETAVNVILGAENVYIIGLRSCAPLAEFLQFYLNMIRGNVTLLNSTSVSETFEQMIRISDKDVMIGISFPRYSMRIVDSLVAPLSVINALVVALCLKKPQDVKTNLENLESVWNNYQVYLNDEINFIDEEPMLDNPLWKGNDA